MKYSNITGWLLLAAGLAIIILTLISSYNIFTAKSEAPAFFDEEKQEETIIDEPIDFAIDPQEGMDKIMEEQISKMIPHNTMPKMLNLIVWSMLAFILIIGGSHIGNLGVKLIRNKQEISE